MAMAKAARVVFDTVARLKAKAKAKAALVAVERKDKGNGKGAPRGDVGKRFWHSKCCDRNVGPPRFAERGVINPFCHCGAPREQAFEYWTDACGKKLTGGQTQAAEAAQAEVDGKTVAKRKKRKNKKKNKEVQDFDEDDEEEGKQNGDWNFDEAEDGQETEYRRLTRQSSTPKPTGMNAPTFLKG